MSLGEDDIFYKRSVAPDFSQPLNFIFGGVFRHGKNQGLLISAFSKYLKLFKDSQSKLYLPGEGPLQLAAMQLATTLGIREQVVFPGQLDRVAMLDMYNKCQVAIAPANSETFGHCIAEPLVLQRILITKHIGVAIDCVVHGHNGFIFESESDLVNCMKEIREMKVEKLEEISKNAKETGDLFMWATIAARHRDELFMPLLGVNS